MRVVREGEGSRTNRRSWANMGARWQASLLEAGETAREAFECRSGRGRLGARDCKSARHKEERCAVETGPHVTFATCKLLGPVRVSVRRMDTVTPRITIKLMVSTG